MLAKQNENTVVYKFSLDSAYPHYEARGKVTGTIINQFAMDEYEGNLRIATTDVCDDEYLHKAKGIVSSDFQHIVAASYNEFGILINISNNKKISIFEYLFLFYVPKNEKCI